MSPDGSNTSAYVWKELHDVQIENCVSLDLIESIEGLRKTAVNPVRCQWG